MFEKRKRSRALHQLIGHVERHQQEIWTSIPDRPYQDRSRTTQWMPEKYAQFDLDERVLLTLHELQAHKDFRKKPGAKLFPVKQFTEQSLGLCRYIAHLKWLNENSATTDYEAASRYQGALLFISREMNQLRYEHGLEYDANFFTPGEVTEAGSQLEEKGTTFFPKGRAPEFSVVHEDDPDSDDEPPSGA